MEDVLDWYAQAPDPKGARLCFDECPCQLLADVTDPLPLQPGQSAQEDYAYERHGTAVMLLAYDLDRDRRYVQVRRRRTKAGYAQVMVWLTTTHYAKATKVQIVQDNLNTHTYGAFYENLPCEQAHALMRRIEFHFTPKHAVGSTWPNSSSRPWPAGVSASVWKALPVCNRKCKPGPCNAIRRASAFRGPSPPRMPVTNCAVIINPCVLITNRLMYQ